MRIILVAALAIAPLMAKDSGAVKRLNEATDVLSEIMSTPDKGIPQDLLANTHCIVIVPALKTAAFLVGGKYGKGYESCRKPSMGGWSAPASIRIEGGSVRFQIGGSETDVVMLAMNKSGKEKLLPSQVEWAERIRCRVNADFDRVAASFRAVAEKQQSPRRSDTHAMISILEDKRAEVMGRHQAGYFIHDWQEIDDQIRQMISSDPRFQEIKAKTRCKFRL